METYNDSPSENQSEPLYLKVKSSSLTIQKNLKKNTQLFNEISQTSAKGILYIEQIQDGFLFIIKNLEFFSVLDSLDMNQIRKESKKIPETEKGYLFDSEFKLSQIPRTGIELYLAPANFDGIQISSFMRRFSSKIHPDIKIHHKLSENKIILSFLNKSALDAFSELIYWIIFKFQSNLLEIELIH